MTLDIQRRVGQRSAGNTVLVDGGRFHLGVHYLRSYPNWATTTSPSPCERAHFLQHPRPETMEDDYNLQEIFNFREWNSSQRSSAVPPVTVSTGVDESQYPLSVAASTTLDYTPAVPTSQQDVPSDKVTFMKEADWDPKKTYTRVPRTCFNYVIDWRVTVKRRIVLRSTESHVVVTPSCFWERFLKARLEALIHETSAESGALRPLRTNLVISTSARSILDVSKQFSGIDIDWVVVQTQLEDWAEHFSRGKTLLVKLYFTYTIDDSLASSSARRIDKRGLTSTSQRRYHELDTRVGAEEATTGQPSRWHQVYQLMRCPGPPCNLGSHCWIDAVGKKHYKLLTHHLKELVKYAEQGNQLRTHDDVPEAVRQQLYAEEQQKQSRRSGKSGAVVSTPSSVTININPGQPQQDLAPDGVSRSGSSVHICDNRLVPEDLQIEGFRDVAVAEYSQWLQDQYRDPLLQEEVRKAEKALLDEGFNLAQICHARNSDFLRTKEIKRGVADSFINDIPIWNKRRKANSTVMMSGRRE